LEPTKLLDDSLATCLCSWLTEIENEALDLQQKCDDFSEKLWKYRGGQVLLQICTIIVLVIGTKTILALPLQSMDVIQVKKTRFIAATTF